METNKEIIATVVNTCKYGLYQRVGGISKLFSRIKMTSDGVAKLRRMPSACPKVVRRFPHQVPHPAPSPRTHLVQLEPPRLKRPNPTCKSANSSVVLLSNLGCLESCHFNPSQLNNPHSEPPPLQPKASNSRWIVDLPCRHRKIGNRRIMARCQRLFYFVFLCLLSHQFWN